VLKLISIGILFLFITSCATTAPVLNTSTPLYVYGVSALSSENGGWSVITTSGYQVALKTSLNDSDSSVINMSIYQIPELSTDHLHLI
jgi:2-methylisocitrate lyase-like PEP mutase family enzyme